jgi:S-disulfanyl-L-cysteine oxidoreductase SoxD
MKDHLKFLFPVFTVLGIFGVVVGTKASQQSTDAPRSVWDGVYTEAQSTSGQAVYTKTCASCHADNLVPTDGTPALVGDEFLTKWDGASVGDLFDQVRVSMPQEDPGKLKDQEYADVVAFIFHTNSFPAGQSPMGADLASLKTIRIDKKKPE